MASKKKKIRGKIPFQRLTPGELYREISSPVQEFGGASEKKLVKKKVDPFVLFCRNIHRRFPGLGKGAKFKENFQNAIEFLGWDLKAEEFAAASKFVLIASLVGGVALALIVINSPLGEIINAFVGVPFLTLVYAFLIPVIAAFFLTNYVQNYPLNAVKMEQTRSLTYVPEIIGYMIMSMKLVPNLEKAVEFSADHGRGKISEDFKKMIWDVQVGVYGTLSEALDELAYKWGKYSDEFKRALMMIRASVLEGTEAKRYALLDKTMATVLESIKEKMEQYARSLSQPSILLFYMGVLLPLILIIILPIGSAFTNQPMARPEILFLIYNVLIPAVIFIFARNIIKQRPPTYEPPIITDNHPGLPKKWKTQNGADVRALIAVVFVAGMLGSLFLSVQGLPPKFVFPNEEKVFQILPADKSREEVLMQRFGSTTYFDVEGELFQQKIREGMSVENATKFVGIEATKFFMEPEHDITPYNLIFGFFITFSITLYIFLYYTNIYKRRIQAEIMEMESEFKDSLYVLASRLGENKPVEEALAHTKNFLPGLKVSDRVFGKTVDNIHLMGLPLKAALFDPRYGSLRDIPSNIIQSAMKILVDSVQLGVNVAARTLISLSLQITNSEKVTKMLKTLVIDTTSMMQTMATFIAPVVLGVTTSLQKVVMNTLASIGGQAVLEEGGLGSAGVSIPGAGGFAGLDRIGQAFGNPEMLQAMASPAMFISIVAIYIIELVFIITYFTTKIQEDNDLLMKINVARALPIAMAVFLVATIVSNLVVGNFF